MNVAAPKVPVQLMVNPVLVMFEEEMMGGGGLVVTDSAVDGAKPLEFIEVMTTLYSDNAVNPDQVTDPEVPFTVGI